MENFIGASHIRCSETGLSPENFFSRKIIKGAELQKKLDSSKELLSTGVPFMNHLYDFLKDSRFFAILCDGDGCILNVVGNEEILSEAKNLKMITGAYMDEANIGTNAMSLALSQKEPVQVSGKEHFIKAYHKWTCSASPIKDFNGNIIGIIDLTGYIEDVHGHTLGMVVAAANAIEKMLEINKYTTMLEVSKNRIETTMNSISMGIITADLDGNIITKNNQALKMFGYSRNEMENMKISNLIQNWTEIIERVHKGVVVDEDVYVNARVNKLQITISAYPIYDKDKNISEITFLFSEIRKNRKLAGKILSGQAVYTFDKIIGKDKKFKEIIDYAKKVSDSKSTLLLNGESGTGKEVFAQAIHNNSSRREEPFIAVNCGAIPRTLIESELFGYEEGAFTGSKKGGNAGKFEIAEGGTIFLDEMGEMPFDMQINLLRVIEEGVINRVGSSKSISIDVRIIAATNKDLIQEVQRGTFRMDLYYRLNVLPVYLPPLRERKDDIPELVNYYMNKTSRKLNKRMVYISPEYMEYLKNYNWPGNIRELENVIERIVNSENIVTDLGYKDSKELDKKDWIYYNRTLEEVEKQHIIEVINSVKGNMSLAGKILGIGRSTLYRKILKYEIECFKMVHNPEMKQL